MNGVFLSKKFDESPEAVKQLIEKSKRHGNEHAVHVEWIERIEALWDLLQN